MLQIYTVHEIRGQAGAYVATPEARQQLRDGVREAFATPNPPICWVPGETEVLMGVLASDARLAVRALRDWCQALDLPYRLPESRVEGVTSLAAIQGSVYVKYHSQTQLCYASAYQGKDRGVLLQLGQAQLGHLPLGLWDEARANPPPALS